MTKISSFDTAEYLDNEELIAEYLAASQEEGADVFAQALATVVRARKMIQYAKDTGLGDENIYKKSLLTSHVAPLPSAGKGHDVPAYMPA